MHAICASSVPTTWEEAPGDILPSSWNDNAAQFKLPDLYGVIFVVLKRNNRVASRYLIVYVMIKLQAPIAASMVEAGQTGENS
jgi:hypothetical protein